MRRRIDRAQVHRITGAAHFVCTAPCFRCGTVKASILGHLLLGKTRDLRLHATFQGSCANQCLLFNLLCFGGLKLLQQFSCQLCFLFGRQYLTHMLLMACPEIRDFVVHYRAHLDCQASARRTSVASQHRPFARAARRRRAPSPGRAEQVDGDTFKRAGLPNRRFEISAPAAGLRRRNRDNRRQGDAEGPL